MIFNRVISQSGNVGSSSFLDVDFSWREYDKKNAEARVVNQKKKHYSAKSKTIIIS